MSSNLVRCANLGLSIFIIYLTWIGKRTPHPIMRPEEPNQFILDRMSAGIAAG